MIDSVLYGILMVAVMFSVVSGGYWLGWEAHKRAEEEVKKYK